MAYQSNQYRMNLEVDLSGSHYQWDLMQPVYGEWDTQESRDAVALLMRDCGYAIDMDYGATSGAEPDTWPVPLMTYFGYDRALTNRRRENYSLAEWNHIIHTELQAGRPVFASGFASSGGHAFVIDGIDGIGLFHINWGWSSVSNGYFRTSALTPAIQGTGGADGGFNSHQTIITGIQPAQTYDLLGRRIADRAVPERCSSARSLSGIYIELPANGSRQGKSGRKVVKR